jgi:hypothetical protein
MKIIFEEKKIDRVASDDADGKFFTGSDGAILYLGPGEIEPWYVNASLEQFRRSTEAYKDYGTEVVTKKTEQEQLGVVAKFLELISTIDNHEFQHKSYWLCIVQQAKDGQI